MRKTLGVWFFKETIDIIYNATMIFISLGNSSVLIE
jgi:hypothetical protein